MQVQKKQINALLRKSLTFQKKNYCMNACLVISPILLTGLLGLLQFLIGRVINEENKARPRTFCTNSALSAQISTFNCNHVSTSIMTILNTVNFPLRVPACLYLHVMSLWPACGARPCATLSSPAAQGPKCVQCGCACIRCELPGGAVGDGFDACNDPDAPPLACTLRDEDNCGAQFSDFEQVLFCGSTTPARFPPLYAIEAQVAGQEATGGGGFRDGPLGTASEVRDVPQGAVARYLWTGGADAAFASAVMGRVVRQPSLLALASDPTIARDIQVRSSQLPGCF